MITARGNDDYTQAENLFRLMKPEQKNQLIPEDRQRRCCARAERSEDPDRIGYS